MMNGRMWVYGISADNDVVMARHFDHDVADARLEKLARHWKAECGCTNVFWMMDSKMLKDAWNQYARTKGHPGLHDFAKFELVDYIKSGECEIMVQ